MNEIVLPSESSQPRVKRLLSSPSSSPINPVSMHNTDMGLCDWSSREGNLSGLLASVFRDCCKSTEGQETYRQRRALGRRKRVQGQRGMKKQKALRNQQFSSGRRIRRLWRGNDIGQWLEGKVWGPICHRRESELPPEERRNHQSLLFLAEPKSSHFKGFRLTSLVRAV